VGIADPFWREAGLFALQVEPATLLAGEFSQAHTTRAIVNPSLYGVGYRCRRSKGGDAAHDVAPNGNSNPRSIAIVVSVDAVAIIRVIDGSGVVFVLGSAVQGRLIQRHHVPALVG
jgi:hypothetical protein